MATEDYYEGLDEGIPLSDANAFELVDDFTPELIGRKVVVLVDSNISQSPENEKLEKLLTIGHRLQTNQEHLQALGKYEEAIRVGSGPYDMFAFAYNNIGECYRELGLAEKGINYYSLALDIARIAKDEEMECIAANNLGVAEYMLGNFTVAVADHLQSLQIGTRLSDHRARLRSFGNLGNAYAALGKFSEAIIFHEQQLRLSLALGDTQAEARSSFNLENDHNSIGHYDIADRYHEKKIANSSPQHSSLNAGFGDRNRGTDVRTGWVVKHKGGSHVEGPEKILKRRRWGVLSMGVFAYYSSTKSDIKPERFIKLSDVVNVEAFTLDPRESAPTSFKVTCAERCFYFTCTSATECEDWIEAFQRDRTHFASFGGTTVTSRPRGFTTSDQMFSPKHASKSSQGPDSSNGEAIQMSSSRFHEVPESYQERRVTNPLYNLQVTDDELDGEDQKETNLDELDEDEASNLGRTKSKRVKKPIENGFHRESSDGGSPPKVWASSSGRQPRKDQSWDGSESRNSIYQVRFVGAEIVSYPAGARMPSTHDIHKTYLAISNSPESSQKKIQMTVKEDIIENLSKGLRTELTIHKMEDIVNVMSFDLSLILVAKHAGDEEAHMFKAFVYACKDVVEANELKRIVMHRSHTLKYLENQRFQDMASDEPDVMEHTPIVRVKKIEKYDDEFNALQSVLNEDDDAHFHREETGDFIELQETLDHLDDIPSYIPSGSKTITRKQSSTDFHEVRGLDSHLSSTDVKLIPGHDDSHSDDDMLDDDQSRDKKQKSLKRRKSVPKNDSEQDRSSDSPNPPSDVDSLYSVPNKLGAQNAITLGGRPFSQSTHAGKLGHSRRENDTRSSLQIFMDERQQVTKQAENLQNLTKSWQNEVKHLDDKNKWGKAAHDALRQKHVLETRESLGEISSPINERNKYPSPPKVESVVIDFDMPDSQKSPSDKQAASIPKGSFSTFSESQNNEAGASFDPDHGTGPYQVVDLFSPKQDNEIEVGQPVTIDFGDMDDLNEDQNGASFSTFF